MNQCVYCGSTATLNTQIAITLDTGDKVAVDICDIHAEEASIKTAKKAYLDKQSKINEVLEAARKLGLNISEAKSGLITVTAPSPSKAQEEPLEKSGKVNKQQSNILEQEENTIDTSLIDSKQFGLDTSKFVAGTGIPMPSVDSISINQLEDKLDPAVMEGKAVIAVAEGKAGIPVAYAKSRVDGTGTTHVSINKSDNDEKLQKRFKKMAANSKANNVPDFARSGYSRTTTNCPLCRTEGTIKQNNKLIQCPKCNGAGIISIH